MTKLQPATIRDSNIKSSIKIKGKLYHHQASFNNEKEAIKFETKTIKSGDWESLKAYTTYKGSSPTYSNKNIYSIYARLKEKKIKSYNKSKKITYKGVTKELRYYKGLKWNKPLTIEMIQFNRETGKNAVRGGKITGTFEYWLYWRKDTKAKSKPISTISKETKIFNWFACPRCGYWYSGDYYEKSKTCPKCTKYNSRSTLLNKWYREENNFEKRAKEHNDKYFNRLYDLKSKVKPKSKKRTKIFPAKNYDLSSTDKIEDAADDITKQYLKKLNIDDRIMIEIQNTGYPIRGPGGSKGFAAMKYKKMILVTDVFKYVYSKNPNNANKILKHAIAHEIGHMINRHSSVKRMDEELADKMAVELSGITNRQFNMIVQHHIKGLNENVFYKRSL